MSVYRKPRFAGQHIDSDSRYEHFLNYMNHVELGGEVASIYRLNFESQIKHYLKLAASSMENLLPMEKKLRAIKTKDNLSATGLIAQRDAQQYVLEALQYSREAILVRIQIDG